VLFRSLPNTEITVGTPLSIETTAWQYPTTPAGELVGLNGSGMITGISFKDIALQAEAWQSQEANGALQDRPLIGTQAGKAATEAVAAGFDDHRRSTHAICRCL
jgi:hypothetical protein